MTQLTTFKVGLAIMSLWFLLSLTTPFLPIQLPQEIQTGVSLVSSSWDHYLGTNQLGQDVLSQLLWGARTSLFVSICVVFISSLLGLILGGLAGLNGGLVDLIVVAAIEIVFAFPGFLLVLAIAAMIENSSISTLIIVLGLTGWPSYARLVRSEVVRLMQKDYVTSGTAIGLKPSRLFVFYIIPNLLPALLIKMAFGVSSVILIESSLSFLGVGTPTKVVSWGKMIHDGRHFILERPALVIYPTVALLSLLAASIWIANGLQQNMGSKKL